MKTTEAGLKTAYTESHVHIDIDLYVAFMFDAVLCIIPHLLINGTAAHPFFYNKLYYNTTSTISIMCVNVIYCCNMLLFVFYTIKPRCDSTLDYYHLCFGFNTSGVAAGWGLSE